MVITAWIVFIISVGLMIMHILLYKKNEAYHNRIKAIFKRKWTVVMGVLLFPILLYIIATSFLIMVQGDCFVGYYVTADTIYYDGAYYKEVTDEAKKEEILSYGHGHWTYTQTFISSDRVGFPYFEYWIPDMFFYHVVAPGDKEDIYIILRPIEEQLYFERQ